jgi:hypothetical protein
MSKKNNKLTCVLDRFKDSQAVLVFNFSKNNTQEIIVPKRYLPKNIKTKDVLYVDVLNEKLAQANKKNLARHLLDEIINTN